MHTTQSQSQSLLSIYAIVPLHSLQTRRIRPPHLPPSSPPIYRPHAFPLLPVPPSSTSCPSPPQRLHRPSPSVGFPLPPSSKVCIFVLSLLVPFFNTSLTDEPDEEPTPSTHARSASTSTSTVGRFQPQPIVAEPQHERGVNVLRRLSLGGHLGKVCLFIASSLQISNIS